MSATDRMRRSIKRARSNRRWPNEGLPDEYVMLDPDDAEALCDLADAARRVPDDGKAHATIRAEEGLACDRCMVLWPCPTVAIRAALAHLDGEGGP